MIIESVSVGPFGVNCYVLASARGEEAILIDPGDQEHKIRRTLEKFGLTPAFIVNTHGHIDHIGANDKFGIPVYVHSLDKGMLSDPRLNLSQMLSSPFACKAQVRTLEDGDLVELQGITLRVLHTPGHTPGGISLLMGNMVFSGDTLFCRSIGRADFPGADEAQLVSSIRAKLFTLPDDTLVYPGHGPVTTIGEEKKENPFL
ncbi:MAG: MBL fold metallo-hydrolase [Candidatus Omnitrophica bacterium]|nr:MBL fold metallo-hydrolase [Candidatus Omnitrophota bacterium]